MNNILDVNARKIILALEMQADRPLTEVAKITGLKEYTVRDKLKRLIEKKILFYYPFINVYPLGLLSFSIYIGISPTLALQQSRIIAWLQAHPAVSWLSELGGKYNYVINIVGEKQSVVSQFLEEVSEQFGAICSSRSIVAQQSLYIFRTKYFGLNQNFSDLEYLAWTETEKCVEVDATDEQILASLLDPKYSSQRDIARALGLAPTTFFRRVARLQQAGVIVGSVYFLNTLELGLHQFKLLVSFKALTMGLDKEFFEYCKKHPNITVLLRSIGAWDYEVSIEVPNGSVSLSIVEQINKNFVDKINFI